jgi:hypothetical protein
MAHLPSLSMLPAVPPAMPPQPEQLGVVDQIVVAFNLEFARSKRGRKLLSRVAAIWGFVFGGAVPVTTYCEVHYDLDTSLPLHSQVATFLILGGLLFSAKTVFAWAKLAFDDGLKAAGFVVLLEGVMVSSNVPVLPLVLLALLVIINGVATACILSRGCRNLTAASTPDVTPAALVELPLAQAIHSAAGLGVASFAQRPASARVSPVTLVKNGTAHSATGPRVKRAASVSSPQKHFAFELSGPQPSSAGASRNG